MNTTDDRVWVKRSSPNGNCLELAQNPDGTIAIREGEQPETEVRTSKANLATFIEGAKAGEFDFLVQ